MPSSSGPKPPYTRPSGGRAGVHGGGRREEARGRAGRAAQGVRAGRARQRAPPRGAPRRRSRSPRTCRAAPFACCRPVRCACGPPLRRGAPAGRGPKSRALQIGRTVEGHGAAVCALRVPQTIGDAPLGACGAGGRRSARSGARGAGKGAVGASGHCGRFQPMSGTGGGRRGSRSGRGRFERDRTRPPPAISPPRAAAPGVFAACSYSREAPVATAGQEQRGPSGGGAGRRARCARWGPCMGPLARRSRAARAALGAAPVARLHSLVGWGGAGEPANVGRMCSHAQPAQRPAPGGPPPHSPPPWPRAPPRRPPAPRTRCVVVAHSGWNLAGVGGVGGARQWRRLAKDGAGASTRAGRQRPALTRHPPRSARRPRHPPHETPGALTTPRIRRTLP
jgi:hypothetical protein